MDILNIPLVMRECPQWVVWRYKKRKGSKPTKVPYCISDPDKHASTVDPDTWGDFDDALTVLSERTFDGMGFVFTKEAGITGIDLDHCKTGTDIEPQAMHIVGMVDSYTEYSPSGEGLHIYCFAELPDKGIHNGNFEMYDRGRFFTVTGDQVGEQKEVNKAQKVVSALYDKYAITKSKATDSNIVQLNKPKPTTGNELVLQFIAKEYHRMLWDKQISHPSQSEYDLAIFSCATAAGFSKADRQELIYQHRLKWNENPEKAKRPDYIQRTEARAGECFQQSKTQSSPDSVNAPFFIDAVDIIKEPKPIKWLVKEYIPLDSIIWLAGKWSTYKTFVALSIAYHVAHGLPWSGKTTRPGHVLYIAGEGFSGLGKRLKGLEEYYRKPLEPQQVRLTQQAVFMNETVHLGNLIDAVQDEMENVKLIIVDTKSANMAGSDSDPGTMNTWINNVRYLQRRFGCTVLVIDHVGHMETERPRGVSQQMGAADAVYMLEGEEGEVTLTVQKDPKDFPKPSELVFKAHPVELPPAWNDEDGNSITTLVLEQKQGLTPIEPLGKPNLFRLGKKSSQCLDVLKVMYQEASQRLIDQGRNPSFAKIEVEDWKARLARFAISRQTFAHSFAQLEERNLVRIEGVMVFPVSTDAG